MVTDFSHHPFDMFISIDFRYEKLLVKSRYAFEFVETIKFFAVGCACNITRNIHIPPRVVIINPIPCVEIGSIGSRHSVNNIARNILTTAERSKQMGKVKTKALLRTKGLAYIKVLDDGKVVGVIFKV